MNVKRNVVWLVLLVLVLFLGLSASLSAAPGAAGPTLFSELLTKKLTVQNDTALQGDVAISDDVTIGGDTAVGGDASVGGDLDVTDDLTVDDELTALGPTALGGHLQVSGDSAFLGFVILDPATAISVTAGAIITPTASYQPLISDGAVTCSTSKCIEDGSAEGQVLVVRNANITDTITLDGTGGNVECKADIALGPGDTATLLWNGADWNCLASRDN